MHILHVVPTYLPAVRYGGPIYSVHGLCKALAARGHAVDVYTTNVDGAGESAVPIGEPVVMDGVRVTYFTSKVLRRLYFSPSMAMALRKAVRSCDLVHAHSVFLWPTLAAARIAQRRGVPYVISPRGMLVPSLIRRKSRWLKTAWVELFERRTITRAVAVHVTSQSEGEELKGLHLRPRRLWVTPNGIESDAAAPREYSETGRDIVFIGRLNWEKGLDRLIPAMAHVPGVRLVVAGNDEENYLPELQALANTHGVLERVSFVGHVSGEAKLDLLRRAALLVLPSYSENFGNVVLEAWAAGRPVVVTPEVGLAGAVRRSGGGIVTPGDPVSLGGAIRALLEDRVRANAAGLAGRALVEKEFSWRVVAEAMEKHYLSVLATGNRA